MSPQTPSAEAQAVVRECSDLSDRGAASFPEIVSKLLAVGVERYHVDLIRMEKTFYWPDGASNRVAGALTPSKAAATFSASNVQAAVRAAQTGAIQYKEFCTSVLTAGCVGYQAHLAGKRVIYYGRDGDSHTEWFPGAQP
ncbi:MAG TPA: DUF1398 family protein [Alphaproteobacteria bacterium]|nr:DUF1398 family protein [Alphaproteobacteria bacterium]